MLMSFPSHCIYVELSPSSIIVGIIDSCFARTAMEVNLSDSTAVNILGAALLSRFSLSRHKASLVIIFSA